MAVTLSTPCSCWVMPIDHTSTAEPADAYIRANRAMSARDAPDARSSSSNGWRSSSATSSSNPFVCARTNSRSTASSARSSFSTPLKNATSPPTCTPKNSSAIFVPNNALSTLLGTQ